MAAYLLFPLSLAAGVIAGSVAARRAVREEMAGLRAMLRERERERPAAPTVPAPVAAPAPAAPPPGAAVEPVKATAALETAPAAAEAEEISPEVLMVLTAAVAAFLGKRARIRRASLAPAGQSSAWAQQGRVFVQASHALAVPHR